MNWRNKMALERFASARHPLRFSETPGVGEASWKALIGRQWIAPRSDLASGPKWWQIPHEITGAGRAALAGTAKPYKGHITEKPYKGHITEWSKFHTPFGLRYYIFGKFLNHPDFGQKETNTSPVVYHDETTGEIETRNSRYTLIGQEMGPHVSPSSLPCGAVSPHQEKDEK